MDLKEKLKELGVEVYNNAKKEYDAVLKGAKKQIRKDKIRKRFNYENPYRFVLLDNKVRIKFLDSLTARHAKRYDEDDILVFFGAMEENNFQKDQRIKDLSDDTILIIKEIIEVTIPVTLDKEVIDVPCTAVYGVIE